MNKKAEMGIGTLIIFIAMILVAAIAAGVLLQTASALQNKALQTGERSKGQVSTTISPILLFAENGSTNNDVEAFYLKAKLAPGSDPIKLSELLVSFDVDNDSADLIYSTSTCTYNNESIVGNGGFYTGNSVNGTDGEGVYTVSYLITTASHQAGYMQRGEVLQLCFAAPRPIVEDEDISVKLVPKVGTPTYIESATPDIMTSTRIVVYP